MIFVGPFQPRIFYVSNSMIIIAFVYTGYLLLALSLQVLQLPCMVLTAGFV